MAVYVKVLPVEQSRRRPIRMTRPARMTLKILVPVLVLVGWQLGSIKASSASFNLPSPTQVLEGFKELWQNGSIEAAIPASLARAGLGLLFGLAIGIFFGVMNGLFHLFEDLFDATFQIVRVIPFIALVPLFIIWFGIGEQMKIILIALACAFPAYINTYAAVRLVDRKLVEAGQTFGMNRARIIIQIILPASLPSILVGVRTAMGVSLLALIVAEQVNSPTGIGHIIYVASSSLRIDLIMVGIIMYAILGLLVDILMRFVERYSMPWLDAR
ncbi:MAG TPA: ABC transporter permease [Streptosporangiaceae bacterium]|jgi:sulfonate transport system permease protein